MDMISIGKVIQSDFDMIIENAGGNRICLDDTIEQELNADYILGRSIIELKMIEEEGLEKETRQKKLAMLFKKKFYNKPTIVLDPELLESDDQKTYFNIMSTPIKTAVRKAAQQLTISREKISDIDSCGLLLINNGYGSLDHDEFKEIAIRRVTNDTRKIDFLIIGGIYYYGDGFDYYFFPKFELIAINVKKSISNFEQITKEWFKFAEKLITPANSDYFEREPRKFPVIDFEYIIDDIHYVKPSPKIGGSSTIYPHGRPRNNSTGIKSCPPFARTFPRLDQGSWEELKELLIDPDILKNTYRDWMIFETTESNYHSDPLQLFVAMPINVKSFKKWCSGTPATFRELCLYANFLFEEKGRLLRDNAVSFADKIYVPEYILLVVQEIGQDKVNDYCTIVHIKDYGDKKEEDRLIENVSMFYECGIILATVYAIKLNLPAVVYFRDQKYMWE